MDHGADVLCLNAEEMVGFDDFEGFVEHRCGIDSDFCAHVPIGMLKGVGSCGTGDVFCLPGAEGASGSGDDESAHRFGVFAHKALGYGGVLGIDGENPRGGVGQQTVDDGAGHHKGLFVGEGYVFAGINGANGRD